MSTELGIALLGTGLGLGLRHGIDWDHIAAISDVTSSQKNRKRGMSMGSLYAVGHGSVVIVLGLLAIWFGTLFPAWIDGYMEILVGITLILLGVWLLWSMSRNNGRLVLRSRWMLMFDLASSAYRRFLNKPATRTGTARQRVYGTGASVSIGMLHGIGVETGSQALILAAAAGATSALTGSFVLIAFVVGLIVSNTLITIAATAGLIGSDRHLAFHRIFGISIALFSLVIGSMFVLGTANNLPSFFI